jgi:hypothetical protein
MSNKQSSIIDVLKKAGWYEGRDVANALILPSQFTIFPKAHKVLAEFGGLRFGSRGLAPTIVLSSCQEIIPGCTAHRLR